MRGSKARKLRQYTRQQCGLRMPQVDYQPLNPHRVFQGPLSVGPSALFLGHVVMGDCVRKRYQQAKRMYLNAPSPLRVMR